MTTGHWTGLPANIRPAPNLSGFREEIRQEAEVKATRALDLWRVWSISDPDTRGVEPPLPDEIKVEMQDARQGAGELPQSTAEGNEPG